MRELDNFEWNEPVIEKITFYADSDKYRNKLFTFKVINLFAAYNIITYFAKNGNHIRSCYVKGYQRKLDEAILFQQVVNQEFITVLNSGFNVTYPKFVFSLI